MNAENTIEQNSGINYAEFGSPIGNPLKIGTAKKVLNALNITIQGVACAALCSTIITGAVLLVIPSSMALIPFAAVIIPIAITVSSLALTAFVGIKLARAIHKHVIKHRFNYEIGNAGNNIQAPKLGEFIETDLVAINNAGHSFAMKKELIRSATTSIEISFNFAGGQEFNDLLDIMESRMNLHDQLKVHLILSADLVGKDNREKMADLKDKFGDRFNFLITDRIYRKDPIRCSEENHVKLLVVDGKYFLMGGTGVGPKASYQDVQNENEQTRKPKIADKVLDKTFRDSDLAGRGEVAQTMRNQFFNLYHVWEHRTHRRADHRFFDVEKPSYHSGTCESFEKHEDIVKGARLKFIVGGPEHRQKNPIVTELVDILGRESIKQVKVANLLFLPRGELAQAFKMAKGRGVHFTGYFNGTSKKQSFMHHLFVLPNRHHYKLLNKVFEHNIPDQMYHKKVMTIDNKITVIGSFNLGIKSQLCDYESVCVIDNEEITQHMNQALQEDEKNSLEFENEELDKRYCHYRGGLFKRLIGPFFA